MPEWVNTVVNWLGSAITLLLPVGALVLGWWLNQRSDERRDKRALLAATEARAAERALASSIRRNEFELAVLTDLHGAVATYARLAARYFMDDLRQARKRQILVGSQPIEDDQLDEDFRLATVELSRLSQLLLNDDLRARVELMRTSFQSISDPPKSVDEALVLFDACSFQLTRVHGLTGSEIRRLYEEAS